MGPWLGLPSSQRGPAIAAAAMLCVLMAGHTILETARDSLFLARLPVTQLPWAYALIAVAALLWAEGDRRLRARFPPRRLLSFTLLGGALGAALFTQAFRLNATWAPHAFYVWVALVASLATTQFWLLLADVFTVAEAKRVYSMVGAGGLVGAGLGGALARISADGGRGDSSSLLLLGAGLLALAALVPGVGAAAASRPPHNQVADTTPALATLRTARSAARDLRSERYLRRLLGLTLLSTIAITLIDFAFKAEVARTVAPAQLAAFFGTYNAWLSGAALIAQLVVAPQLLLALGVGRALVVLPAVLALATIGALAVPGLVALVLLRGVDGSLRHSLQRSTLELLFLPLPSQARARWKLVVDVLGQRGGQALAAFAILGALAAGLQASLLLASVLCVCAVWIALCASMERHYLALFRAKIQAGSIETRASVPELDLRSLESLVAALGSENDEEVLAAIDLLVDYDRGNAIPALLLHHPSPAIVVRALEVLASSGRRDFAGTARRLLSRNDDEIRAAAMLALANHLDADELRRELESEAPIAVRAAALAALTARGLDADGAYAREVCEGIGPAAELETRMAFARAFRLSGDESCVPVLGQLAERAGSQLQLEVARAMLAVPHPSHVPALLQMLSNRNVRAVARDALVAIGDQGLAVLGRACLDPELPRSVRTHLPRSIARFGWPASAELLLNWFEHEQDGWVRFKIIRALGLLRPHLRARRRREQVIGHGRSALVRAVQCMAVRLSTELDRLADARLSTQCGELLVAVLREKESHAIDRAIRLIGLLHSANGIHTIRQALASRDRRLRADGIELLLHDVPRDIAEAMSVLLEAGPDQARVSRAAAALGESIAVASYEERLRIMLADESVSLRCVVAYHVGELGLTSLSDAVAAAAERSPDMAGEVFARVQSRLTEAKAPGSRLGTGRYARGSLDEVRGDP